MSDTGVTTSVTQPTTDTWINTIQDAELRGHATIKGWDKLDPTAAFEQAARSHRQAERLLGAPADHLLRLPTRPDDEASWKAVWSRLGAPESPDGYDVGELDFGDAEASQRFRDGIKSLGAEIGVPKDMLERLAKNFHKFVSDGTAAKETERAAKMEAIKADLIRDWGREEDSSHKANMFLVHAAAEKLGVTSEQMEQFRDVMGADAARMFAKLGRALGEDKYVTAPTGSGVGGMLSRDQAMARRSELMADRDWSKRYMNGGAAEKREMLAINSMLAGA